MYSKDFYIKTNSGNNAFSFDKRENKKLYVPSLKKINSLNEIKLGYKIVFEDFDENGILQTCKGLKNFYEIEFKSKKLYLFDNHNHAYFFWHKARIDGIIGNNLTLIHIDEHSDLRNPGIFLEKSKLNNLGKIFDYTNEILNVGNYIIPGKKDGIIKKIIQIRSETELESYEIEENEKFILNLDLDFFEPNLDYIDYKLKKETIQKLTKKASLITVATSPFFINQELALNVFKDLFIL